MVQQIDSHSEPHNFSPPIDPSLLHAARNIYVQCYAAYPEKAEQTSGVAIDRETYRGQLMFRDNPILLPWESFIPSEELVND